MGFKKGFLFFNIILVVVLPLKAQTDFLSIELFTELQPISLETVEANPEPSEELYLRLLEEARHILAGMIYGFSFRYVPADKARGVAEIFELKPLGEIEWGDKRLKIINKQIIKNRLYLQFFYDLEPFQKRRIEGWQSITQPAIMGKGEGLLFEDLAGKQKSLAMAIKQAVHNYLRTRILNKPREIKGEVLLLEVPQTIIYAGKYITTVKLKANLRQIIPYKVY